MKKLLIIAACVVIVLAGTFAILFFGNVGDFKVWFMETTELLLPRPIHIKTLEDVQESFDVWFPSQAEIKDFTVEKRYIIENHDEYEEKICVAAPYCYYLEVTMKEQSLEDFLAVMRGKRSGYGEAYYNEILSPCVPDKNTAAADKKIQYQFESYYSVSKYKQLCRGLHHIQVTEPEDGVVTVYCAWFVYAFQEQIIKPQ